VEKQVTYTRKKNIHRTKRVFPLTKNTTSLWSNLDASNTIYDST